MLYGIRKDDVTTMVVGIANNNYAALEQWYRHLQDDTDLVINVYETNFMDHFSDEFARAQQPVFIISHPSVAGAEAFIAKHEITILQPNAAWDRHVDTVQWDVPSFYDVSETRTIEELEGLDQNDPWDKRSDDEKAQDAEFRAKIDELKKAGQLTGDGSFSPRKPKDGDSKAHVTDIRVSTNADGTVDIDNVLAVKDYSNLRGTLQEAEKKQDGETPADL
jgi:hypothetical protein